MLKNTYCVFPFNMKFKIRQNKSIGTEVGIMITRNLEVVLLTGKGVPPSGIIDSVIYLDGDYTGVYI